ncbi:MAG: hypothetical protein MUF18_02550 [Fimbriiglobus sp.]|jgi:hypothetical protein|nr:hypothetical protein [Fimbriiglobus sp.]
MLTEPEQLLITAAVDGELSPAEAKEFDRLLAAKPVAARLYRRLKADAARLAALPRHPAPSDLARRVMARVRPVAPARKPTPRGRSFLPYLVAASLFVGAVGGSFLFFRGNPIQTEQAQQNRPSPEPSVRVPHTPADTTASAKPGRGEDGVSKPADNDGAFAKLPAEEPKAEVLVQAPPKAMTPEEKELFGAGLMVESKPLRQVEPVVPMVLSGLEFHKEEPQARMKAELDREGGFRLNLFSKNTPAAAEQVAAAARSVGVNLFVEGQTAERIKKPLSLPYAVYVENLTAAELAALLGTLSKQVNEQSRPETILGTAHFVPADVQEQKDLKELLGLDWMLPRAKADGKAVSDGTLKELVASVKKPGEKAAVLVTYAAKLNAGKTPEVKQFADKRGDRKPGTVPLLVVIRPQP